MDVASPAGATAASGLDVGEQSPWRFEFNTWVWLMGLDGSVAVRGSTADVHQSFVDIIDKSSSIGGFSGRLELGYGKFGIYVDGLYADISMDNVSGRGGIADVDINLEETIVDFGAMYRILDELRPGEAARNGRNRTVDIYAGGRYTDLDVDFNPAQLETRHRQIDWTDPIIGAKLVSPIAENWHYAVNGDIGGFGVASDFTWSATAIIGYDFKLFGHPAAIMAGYRAIGWDYTEDNKNEFNWDITQHGIIIGFELKF